MRDTTFPLTDSDAVLQQIFEAVCHKKKVEITHEMTTAALYEWMPDNQALFEKPPTEHPFHALEPDNNMGDYFVYKAIAWLGDHFREIEAKISFEEEGGSLRVSDEDERERDSYNAQQMLSTEIKEDWQRKGLLVEKPPPSNEDVLLALVKLMHPTKRARYEREITQLYQEHPEMVGSVTAALEGMTDDILMKRAISEMTEQIGIIHNRCKEFMKHPLIPIVEAYFGDWHREQTAKPITKEYDSKKPAAVIPSEHLGGIRDIIVPSFSDEIGELKGISAPAPGSNQIEIPGLETNSILPTILPLQAVHMVEGMETTKRGAVAMPIRLFFEALIALDPNETEADIRFKLGDLLKYLNPNAKYHRTNHLPYVLEGLHSLYFLRIPYRSDPDKPSTEVDWIPVLPRTVPNPQSGDDASIILEVKLPPDARRGMMIEKHILRLTGKKSSARFNAYLTACWVFDRYGTVKGTLTDPTRPVENRTGNGNLIDHEGNLILDSRGKPIKDLYHEKAISQLEREPNPKGEKKYPILSFDDLLRACFPKSYPKSERAKYLKRAQKAWEALETDGFIQIKRFPHGWRIMPSEQHLGRYRALNTRVKKVY